MDHIARDELMRRRLQSPRPVAPAAKVTTTAGGEDADMGGAMATASKVATRNASGRKSVEALLRGAR